MLILLETLNTSLIEMFFFGISDAVGVLIFGIGLIAIAILLRWVLGRGDVPKGEEEIGFSD